MLHTSSPPRARDDHFQTHDHDPIVLLASAATATKTINLGTLVFAVDYRHPVIYARTAAALHLISGGRFELGIGAGWDQRDYTMAGIQFDKPIVRIRRLNEALTIIHNLWTQEKTSFKGKHYAISEMVQAGDLSDEDHPKLMVGGGGKQLLTRARKQGVLRHIEETSPGGHRKIYFPLMDEDEFVKHIVKTMVRNMMKDFPEESKEVLESYRPSGNTS